MLKTTESGFEGFPRDRYTTLHETDDRILATDVAARWRYDAAATAAAAARLRRRVRRACGVLLLEAFAERYSAALQPTLFDMGSRVLERHPEIAEIRFVDAEQAPLRRRPRARSASTTRTRCSSPPTAPTG